MTSTPGFQFKGGIRGEIADTTWSYDAYIQEGSVTSSNTQSGNVNRDRFKQALLLDLTDPTGGTCADTAANGSTTGCAPINIFGEGNISEAGAAFLTNCSCRYRRRLTRQLPASTLRANCFR